MSDLQVQDRHFTALDIRAQVNLIQEVMQAVMKKDEHYGTIPGTKKPSLYKPGAEKLLVTFRIAAQAPLIEDLSTSDTIRYRVTRPGQSINSGAFLGAGVGECSSDEEKYKWRKPVCDEEWEEAAVDRRREVWKKYDGKTYKQKQIRTNPADVANTILKMADKRAYVALALQTTAASDIFTQDIEDMPAEVAEAVAGEEPHKEPIKAPVAKKAEKKADVNSVTFVPAVISVKNGEGKNGSWTKYGIKDDKGAWYGTFDESLGQRAEIAKEEGRQVVVSFDFDGKYNNITALEIVEAAQ